MVEHGRLVIEASSAGCPAAGEDLRALVHRVADLPGYRGARVGAGERPDRHLLLGGVPEPEFPDAVEQPPGEGIGRRFLHDDALGGDARLPCVLEAAARRPGGRGIEVGVREDDERVAAAHFQDGLPSARGPRRRPCGRPG
jgi:hypothetical protein